VINSTIAIAANHSWVMSSSQWRARTEASCARRALDTVDPVTGSSSRWKWYMPVSRSTRRRNRLLSGVRGEIDGCVTE